MSYGLKSILLSCIIHGTVVQAQDVTQLVKTGTLTLQVLGMLSIHKLIAILTVLT